MSFQIVGLITNQATSWFANYLDGRSHCVQMVVALPFWRSQKECPKVWSEDLFYSLFTLTTSVKT